MKNANWWTQLINTHAFYIIFITEKRTYAPKIEKSFDEIKMESTPNLSTLKWQKMKRKKAEKKWIQGENSAFI